MSPGIQRLDELQKVLGSEKVFPLGMPEAVVAMALTVCRQAIDTEAVAQIEMLVGARACPRPPSSPISGEPARRATN